MRMWLTLEALGDLVANVAVVAEGHEQGGHGHRSHYHYQHQRYALFPSVLFICLHFPMSLLHHNNNTNPNKNDSYTERESE